MEEKWSKETQDEIIRKLKHKGVRLPCSGCGHNNFSLLNGYFNTPIQSGLTGMVLGGPSIPTVVAVCTNCGRLSQHALGPLGLLPRKGGEDVSKP